MKLAFSQQLIVERNTNIELYKTISEFVTRMEEHIIKYPSYSYEAETLGGEPGDYKARLIITKHGKNKTKLAKGNSSSYGTL